MTLCLSLLRPCLLLAGHGGGGGSTRSGIKGKSGPTTGQETAAQSLHTLEPFPRLWHVHDQVCLSDLTGAGGTVENTMRWTYTGWQSSSQRRVTQKSPTGAKCEGTQSRIIALRNGFLLPVSCSWAKGALSWDPSHLAHLHYGSKWFRSALPWPHYSKFLQPGARWCLDQIKCPKLIFKFLHHPISSVPVFALISFFCDKDI